MADLTQELISRYRDRKAQEDAQQVQTQADQLRSLMETTGSIDPTNKELGLQFNASSAPQLFSQGLGNISAALGASGTRAELQRRQDALVEAESYKRGQADLDQSNLNRQYGLDLANLELAEQESKRMRQAGIRQGKSDDLARDRFEYGKQKDLAPAQMADWLQQQLGRMEEYSSLGSRLDANKKGWSDLLNDGAVYIDDTSGQPTLAKKATAEQKSQFESLSNTAGLEITGSRLEKMAQQLVDVSKQDDSPLNDFTLEDAKTALQSGFNQAVDAATLIQPRMEASHTGTIGQIQAETAANQRQIIAQNLFKEELATIDGLEKLNPEMASQRRADLMTRVAAVTPELDAYQKAKSEVSSAPNFFGEELKARVPNTLDEGDIANLTSEANTLLGEVLKELGTDKEQAELKSIFKGMGVTDPASRVAILNAVLDPQAGEIDYETFKVFGDANFYEDQLKPRIKAEVLKAAKMEAIDRELKAEAVRGQRKETIANAQHLLTNTGLNIPKKGGNQ